MSIHAKEWSAWLVVGTLAVATRLLAAAGEVGSFALYLSILSGATATLLLTAAFLALLRTRLSTPEGLLAGFLILFSPLILNYGLQHSPDLFGGACALWGIVLLVRRDYQSSPRLLLGVALAGLLCGIAPAYLPLLVLPLLVGVIRLGRPVAAVAVFLVGFLLWFIPPAINSGIGPTFDVSFEQAKGYAGDIGSLFEIEPYPDLETRRVATIEAIVSDGFGAYWSGRSPLLLITLLGLTVLFGRGLWEIFENEPEGLLVTTLSVVVYIAWLLLYRNPVVRPEEVLPIVPLLLAPVWAGGVALMRRDSGGRVIASTALAAIALSAIIPLLENREGTPGSGSEGDSTSSVTVTREAD